MSTPRFVLIVSSLAMTAAVLAPLRAVGQSPPPSALVNQRSQETLEAARAASPHTSEEVRAYFQDEIDAAVERWTQRVWDPTQPREPSPRTPWGDPDVTGYWLSVNYMPLERPDELAGKPLYTVEEAIEAFMVGLVSESTVDPATVHYDWAEFGMGGWQSPMVPNRRTAMIVDPPDGKIPPMTPAGQARYDAQARRHTLESRGVFERCITGNQGPPRIPGIRNFGESQIVQTPDYVLILTQGSSEARVVPLDDRPRPPENIGNWLGAPRGYWEGDTLVVETTNFHEDRKWGRIRGAGGDLHLVERYTRIDEDLLIYEATMTDPTTWEAPWTVEYPWPKMDPPGLFEFACHEMNYGLINVLRGARVRAAEYEAELAR